MTQTVREALAKELYAKAGYGPDNPLKLSIATTVAEINIRRAQGAALMWKKVLGAEVEVNSMERKAWLDLFYTDDWTIFADNLVGDFAGPETFLSYMRPSAEPGYGWEKPASAAALRAGRSQFSSIGFDSLPVHQLAAPPAHQVVVPEPEVRRNLRGFSGPRR